MGTISCWCVCDHTRLEGKYASKGASIKKGQSYKGSKNQMGEKKGKLIWM
jgi:hypothetical protein